MSIIQNAFSYKGKIYISRHRHDFVYDDDGVYWVDGGYDYRRCNFFGSSPAIELYDMYLDSSMDEMIIAKNIVWGTLDKQNNRVYKKLCDLETDHLINIDKIDNISKYIERSIQIILGERNAVHLSNIKKNNNISKYVVRSIKNILGERNAV